MSGLPWFKCYPRDFNDGMMGLTLEERGAYVTILNVIYARGGPIDDDPSYFRALLCCAPKSWLKIRASLIVKRKLFEVSVNGIPSLMNARAAVEIEENQEMRRKFSERGAKGGQKSQAILKENKGLTQQQVDLRSTIEESEADTEKNTTVTNVPVVAREPKPKASKRCPADWSPSPADVQTAADLGFTPGEIERELATIRDCTFGVARSDWSATYRNWFRREAKTRKPRNDRPDKLTARHDNYAASWTGAEQAAGILAARRAL